MSVPTVFDFMQIQVGDGADPEVFTTICDLAGVNVNQGAETQTRYRRDCTKPGAPATRYSRVLGKFWDITGSGLPDVGQIALLDAAIAKHKNIRALGYKDDGTDGGELLGTYAGQAVLTAHNISTDREGDAGQEVTLEGEGVLTWTAE